MPIRHELRNKSQVLPIIKPDVNLFFKTKITSFKPLHQEAVASRIKKGGGKSRIYSQKNIEGRRCHLQKLPLSFEEGHRQKGPPQKNPGAFQEAPVCGGQLDLRGHDNNMFLLLLAPAQFASDNLLMRGLLVGWHRADLWFTKSSIRDAFKAASQARSFTVGALEAAFCPLIWMEWLPDHEQCLGAPAIITHNRNFPFCGRHG